VGQVGNLRRIGNPPAGVGVKLNSQPGRLSRVRRIVNPPAGLGCALAGKAPGSESSGGLPYLRRQRRARPTPLP